jgi:hypothetical protein
MPFQDMAKELKQSVKTVYANNRDALAKARKMLIRKGFKKEDFFGDEHE